MAAAVVILLFCFLGVAYSKNGHLLHQPVKFCINEPNDDACSAFFSKSDPEKLTNIGYVGASYDIFKGNPQSTGGSHDPGFLSSQNIFQFTYNKSKTTADGSYLIPDGTSVKNVDSCSFSFSSSTTKNIQSYTESLKVHADANFKYYGAGFSASADYQAVDKNTKSGEYVYVSSQAECQTYGASIDDAPLSLEFFDEVKNLPSSTNSSLDPYVIFIRTWGTHVASSILMGGRYGRRSKFTTTSYNSMILSKIDVKAAAGYSGLVDVSASLATDSEKELANTYDSHRMEVSTFSLGGKPPVSSNGSAFEWAQSVRVLPMPLTYRLTELYQYLDSHYFPNDSKIEEKRQNLQRAMAVYCKQNVPDPDLCDEEYGPQNSEHKLRVYLKNTIRQATVSETCTSGCSYQYGFNPDLRNFGAIRGVSDSGDSPFVMVDSESLWDDLVSDPVGSVGVSDGLGFIMRHKCKEGFSTITDDYSLAPNLKPPIVACIANSCLTNCSQGLSAECASSSCYFISNGNPELGNKVGQGFFRDLSIKDDTPLTDLFKCLTYKCLDFVQQ